MCQFRKEAARRGYDQGITQSRVEQKRWHGWLFAMNQEGYPVNSLSRRFRANEGKHIFLKCIITHIIHHRGLLCCPEGQCGCEVGAGWWGKQIPEGHWAELKDAMVPQHAPNGQGEVDPFHLI